MSHALDLSVLDALANHDAAKVRKYALLFMQSLDDVLAKIDVAILSKDIAKLGAMGHRAKSTALNVGAADFAQQCLLLERAAHDQKDAVALEIAQTLRQLYVPIQQAITQHLASQPT